MNRQRIMIPEAFKVLPPLSPELPAPTRAPQSHRVAPPASRREKTAFVILHDEKPPPLSRDVSPTGRVSPFRGRGFREESTIRYVPSRDPSPGQSKEIGRGRTRSKLPVASPRKIQSTSTSNSPVRGSPSHIPKPISRRSSLSPNRAMQIMNQVNRNKSTISPSHQNKVIIKQNFQPNVNGAKASLTAKRVGPTGAPRVSNGIVSKPPLPKNNQTVQKENDRRNNLTSPNRRRPPPSKPDVTKSPSRIPRTRSVSRGREANVNVRASSPQRAVVRASPRVQPKLTERKSGTNLTNGMKTTKENTLNKNNVKEEIKKTPNGSKKSNTTTPVEEIPKPNFEIETKIPPPVEAIVSTISAAEERTPELEKRDVVEAIKEDIKSLASTVETPTGIKTSSEVKPEPEPPKPEPQEEKKPEEVPEPKVTLVRTTTAPALELAQPDVIPTIVSKAEQEISKSISEGPSVEDKDENPGEILASVESVRSTTSVETVRAVARVREMGRGEAEVEVLSANNLMKADSNGRTIAWENKISTRARPDEDGCEVRAVLPRGSPEVTAMNNSVQPLDPVLPLQPPKKNGICPRLTEKLCCKGCSCLKTPACCSRLSTRLGALCSKLNCCKKISCSSCCRKTDKPAAAGQKPSRVRECLSRLNCLRGAKCCKREPAPARLEVEDGEERVGCCAGCKNRSRRCCSAMFCLNLGCCQKLRKLCRCDRLACCGTGGCCGPSPPQLDRRKSRMSVRKSQTSITPLGIPKLDPSLVDHQSMMKGAVPVLPLPLAWFCCILNVFLPGTGTLFSGVFCMCFGKPRFSINDDYPSRLTAMLINLVVAVSQAFTVIFCLVGWGWSIWWGVLMIKFGRKQKRILLAEKNSEQAAAAPPVAVNQNHDVERAR